MKNPGLHIRLTSYLLLSVVLLGSGQTGCHSTRDVTIQSVSDPSVSFTVVSDSLVPDKELEDLIMPYRREMLTSISEVIGEASAPFTKRKPEGSLGNMAAEALLEVVQDQVEQPVDMAMTNSGGLRVSDLSGEITVGKIFELMPFDNRMVVLDLSGTQVESLVHQIARAGGEPIAGFSFDVHLPSNSIHNLLIRGRPLDPAGRYRLVTADYLADGGGGLEVLWQPLDREYLPVYLRDAFIQYIREQGRISPVLDGRIKFVME